MLATAYAVVAAVGERGVAAPLDALVRRQPAGALSLEVEQRVGERGAVVGLLLGLAVAQYAEERHQPTDCSNKPRHLSRESRSLCLALCECSERALSPFQTKKNLLSALKSPTNSSNA